MKKITRRDLLKTAACGSALVAGAGAPKMAFATADSDKIFINIMLFGGVDSLAMFPDLNANLAAVRGTGLAMYAPNANPDPSLGMPGRGI